MVKYILARPRIVRNIGVGIFLGFVILVAFFVGQAFANEPEHQTRWLGQKGEQYIIARPATTTTTAPKPLVNTEVSSEAPSSVAVAPTVVVPEGEIQQYIYDQAVAHGLDPQRMLRIAYCESKFSPTAVNKDYYAGGGNPSGIYQYLPETWKRIGGRSGYEATDVFNWQQNVRVTMWAFANGYSGEWACK